MKKLINDPTRVVEEMVQGLVAIHPGLRRLAGETVLIRTDADVVRNQKVALIAALATDAELFIFDEPTSGLDPLKEAIFQECVKEITGRGHTILLSSHILGQLEHLADTFTIIKDGRTVETGSLEHLRRIAASAGRDSDSLSLEDLFLSIYEIP